jgi:hypothetical protein
MHVGIGRAIATGLVWVNGSALLGFVLPWGLMGLAAYLGWLERFDGSTVLTGVIALLILSFITAWLAWSLQVSRWRLWAWRRVDDIEALKASAVAAGLIWPDRHVFERTEIRSSGLSAELARLEEASRTRVDAAKAAGTPVPVPTVIGTAIKALLYGLVVTPLCILAPAGFLEFLGIHIAGNPVYLSLVAAFPLVVAFLIYRRAREDGVTAVEGFRRILPRGIRREDSAD